MTVKFEAVDGAEDDQASLKHLIDRYAALFQAE